jgi:hypothetical protein
MSDSTSRKPAALAPRHETGPSASLLGGTCLLLGVGCLAATFVTPDLAAQSGAVVLGVSLGASGIIAFLAGD